MAAQDAAAIWRRLLLGPRWLAVSALLLLILVAIALDWQWRTIRHGVEEGFARQVLAEAEMAGAWVGAATAPPAGARLGGDRRLTVIGVDGHVTFDNQGDVRTMDPHGDRPEVRQARQTGSGISRRHSDTVGRDLVYAAVRLADGRVVRVAAPVEDERAVVAALWRPTATFAALVVLLAAALVVVQIWRDSIRFGELAGVARSFRAGALDRRAALLGSDALALLGHELNAMGDSLESHRADLARSRELLDAALGALDEGVACIDRLDRVVYANRAWTTLAAEDRQVIGSPYYEHLADAGVSARLESLRADIANGRGEVEFDHRSRRLLATLAPAGEVCVVILRDLTELRRLETARRDFVAAISHELKTPLTAIMGYTDTLLDGVIEEDPVRTRDFVERIARHSDRLASLVHDVLTLSRLEQGTWEVHPEHGDLTALWNLLDAQADQAAERQVSLELDAPGVLPLDSDPELVRQLLGNLLSNAIRYNRPGGKAILRLREDGPERCVISVQDSGIGIPAQHRARIFERFYRVDAHRSRQSGGTGLGLAIVKQLLSVLGGTVELTSGDEGSTFTVTLPRRWQARSSA